MGARQDSAALTCAQVCDWLECGHHPIRAVWERNWPLSEQDWPTRGQQFFSAGTTAHATERIGLRPDTRAALVAAARAVLAAPTLFRLAWHLHHMLFRVGRGDGADFTLAPTIPRKLNTGGALFYALVLLSGYEVVQQRYAARGIAKAVLHRTLQDLERWIDAHREANNGEWGFSRCAWLVHHFQCRLFHVGLLQYELTQYPDPFVALAHADGRRMVLAEEGQPFRGDGQFARCDGQWAPEAQVWRSSLSCRDGNWRGMAVDPRAGVIQREPCVLDAKQWVPCLARGDKILSVHIPAGARLDPEACVASLQEAETFFATHWPEHRVAAYWCSSWLLDPQLAQLLPDTSKIRHFLDLWYLHPVWDAGDGQTAERVFGCSLTAPEQLPAKTSLQKALQAHLLAGGRLRSGNGVILRADVARVPGAYGMQNAAEKKTSS